MTFFIEHYNSNLNDKDLDYAIKWSSSLVAHKTSKKVCAAFEEKKVVEGIYRPFFAVRHYSEKMLNHRLTDNHYQMFGQHLDAENQAICFSGTSSNKPFQALGVNKLPCLDFLEKTQTLPLYTYDIQGHRTDNITDWGLQQFVNHYGQSVSKEAIFHYVYAVLHHPAYREKYALNLKREFPRIPLYGKTLKDFERWAAWGKALMDLHIGYEHVEPFALQRIDVPVKTADESIPPKPKLKADKEASLLILDEITTLSGVPPMAWEYRLGNRSALEWVLDQYKETQAKDPTIRQLFNTYRFADYKEHVIDLLGRVCTVSVQTQAILQAMQAEV